MRTRDHLTVVVVVDFRVSTASPVGDTVLPVELEWLVSVTTPLTLVVRWLLVETDVSDGIGAAGVTVVCVVVEFEDDELCAKPAPDIIVTAIAAASKVLNISSTPRELSANGDRSLPVTGNVALAMCRRQTRKLLNRYRRRALPAPTAVRFAVTAIVVLMSPARVDDATGKGERKQ